MKTKRLALRQSCCTEIAPFVSVVVWNVWLVVVIEITEAELGEAVAAVTTVAAVAAIAEIVEDLARVTLTKSLSASASGGHCRNRGRPRKSHPYKVPVGVCSHLCFTARGDTLDDVTRYGRNVR